MGLQESGGEGGILNAVDSTVEGITLENLAVFLGEVKFKTVADPVAATESAAKLASNTILPGAH